LIIRYLARKERKEYLPNYSKTDENLWYIKSFSRNTKEQNCLRQQCVNFRNNDTVIYCLSGKKSHLCDQGLFGNLWPNQGVATD
jgi:hypothetical protein